MKFARACLCLVVAVGCVTSANAVAQNSAHDRVGPVPPAILAAKSIFVSNAGSDSGLFPSPFTGDPDRAYTEFYAELKATGDYQLADDPLQADLVLELQLFAPNGPTNPNKINGAADPLPRFRLTVYDRKTHYILWTVTESIEAAGSQKAHDKTFDQALTEVLNEFLYIAGKTRTPPN
jgi:hypothetical protein